MNGAVFFRRFRLFRTKKTSLLTRDGRSLNQVRQFIILRLRTYYLIYLALDHSSAFSFIDKVEKIAEKKSKKSEIQVP